MTTAKSRKEILVRDFGYKEYASLTALWPMPAGINWAIPHLGFTSYMNGGSLLCVTYWEILAYAKAGDAEAAYARLQKFAQRAAETTWAGSNGFNIDGSPCWGSENAEPWLSDMVVVPAALVTGIFGIEPTWEKLNVTPSLPAAWTDASANILFKGERHKISIKAGTVTIEKLQ